MKNDTCSTHRSIERLAALSCTKSQSLYTCSRSTLHAQTAGQMRVHTNPRKAVLARSLHAHLPCSLVAKAVNRMPHTILVDAFVRVAKVGSRRVECAVAGGAEAQVVRVVKRWRVDFSEACAYSSPVAPSMSGRHVKQVSSNTLSFILCLGCSGR